MKFINDVKAEFSKISWPTKDELKDSTLVTIFITIVFTVFVWGADNLISILVQMIYGLN